MVGQIGMSHMLRANHLRKLISAGGSADSKNNKVDTNLQLVFVSACHSEDAGKAFINAGAKHVVAVRRSAGNYMLQNLYLSLTYSHLLLRERIDIDTICL